MSSKLVTRPRKLKFALAGLGRIGKKHAANLLNQGRLIDFVAVFAPTSAEFQWGAENLAPYGVVLYSRCDEMMSHPGLDAVLIATAASVHEVSIMQALEQNLHVLCEKPLSTDIEACHRILQAAQRKPKLKVMCGFSRRFDTSYRQAKEKVTAGLIGEPSFIRCQSCDKYDAGGFFVQYSALSGGIFVDMGIHDVDLTLWLLGEDAVPKVISATGSATLNPELLKTNDRDNAMGMIEFHGGKVAQYYVSRMMAHGQEDSTDVIGTEGKVTVNTQPAKDLVNLCHAGGIIRDVPEEFWARFELAFAQELQKFANTCFFDKPLPMKLETAVKALEIAAALQESLVTDKQIRFDVQGQRITRSML